jgi:pilus assembly protein FimV
MMKAAAERAFAARRAAPAKSVAQAAPEAPLARAIAQPARLAMAPVARPAEACSPALLEARTQQCAAMDASNKELTTKLVDLEGKVKRLQTALTAPAAPSAQAPAAPAPAATAKAAQAAPSAQTPVAPTPGGAAKPAQPAPATAVAPPAAAAQSASGAITDARAAKHEDAKPAVAPAAKQAAVSAPPEEKAKKMSRPRLISLIAGGALGLLALIGVSVHLVRKRRAKGGPLKIWQSFRKKDKAEDAVEPTMEEATESAAEATS